MILSNFRGLAVAAIVGVSLFASATSAAAAPTIVVVNSIAALGANGATITFDGVSDTTLAEVATNFGVIFAPVTPGPQIFIAGAGFYSGIGSLASRALGSSNNGALADISQAPNYSGSTFRGFDINFAQPLSAFGLTVQGWGHQSIDHSFTLYDAADQVIGNYTFNQAGLSAGDQSPNGFAGFKVTDGTVSRVRVAPDARYEDFVAFDNISFVSAPAAGVPEPGAWALMIMGFGMAGVLFRRRRAIGL